MGIGVPSPANLRLTCVQGDYGLGQRIIAAGFIDNF
jgi:hypothetical protein